MWWDTLGASQLDRDYLEYGSRCPDVLGVAIAGTMTKGLDKPGGGGGKITSAAVAGTHNVETVRCT